MKKAMFHKFTNFIQQAVDSFTPNVAPQEEFVYHWKSVTSYFVDNKDGGVRIEETAIPEHLSSMLRIIQEEESDLGEAGTTGACLEYLLQHRLLETLYTLGRTDHPPGMKQMVLSFFTKLLSRISHPLLPHINVHRAVQRLVKACGETRAAPTEKEEIEFLCTVCAKIKTDPYLVNFFIENPKNVGDTRVAGNPQRPPQAFSLVNALLSLSHSEDARVSVKACEGLMLCASLPEQSAATTLISHTQFCQSVTSTLCQLYERLPALVSPEDVEAVEAKWGFDDIYERREKQSFAGKHQLLSFLSWLDYCDQLIAVSNPQVGEALAEEIHQIFLVNHFQPNLMQPSESGAIVATTYLTRCLRTVCSQALLKEFCFFLLGKDRNLEQKDSPGHPLHKRLLERCNHLSEEVCVATLKLFDTLLQKEEEHIYHCLLIRNLLGRSYLREATPPASCENKSDVTTSSDEDSKVQVAGKCNPPEDPSHSPDTEITPQSALASTTGDGANLSPTEEGQSKPDANPEDSQESSQSVTADIEAESTGNEKSNQSNADQCAPASNTGNQITAQEDKDSASDNICGGQTKDPTTQTDQENTQENSALPSSNKVTDSALQSSPSSPSSPSTSEPSSSPTLSSSLSSVPSYLSPKFGRSEVHKVVNSFLSLLPEEAKSSYQTADSGYDMYLRDAHKQFSIQETVCKEWAWPRRAATLAEYQMDRFYEGSFLHMLLDKLLHLLDQSYSVNLLLTALIAKVAIVPHPNLHEFLLDPFLPTVEGTKTLYTVLIKVTNEIKHHLKSDATFSQKLLLARKQLLGMVPTIHRFEDQSRMEAIIVLEEFCKELSAITFVKHHAAVTRF